MSLENVRIKRKIVLIFLVDGIFIFNLHIDENGAEEFLLSIY